MSWKTWSACALLGVVLLALCVAALYAGWIRFNHPSFERYPVQGVDVSHHQGPIDWTRLERRRAQFAYIKASEGATFKDARFGENWRSASAAGVVPGAYHYFTLCRPGAEQAENFVSAAAWTRHHGLPPAVDLEFGGNCPRRPSVGEFVSELQAFLHAVEKAWGCVPVLYVTQEFHHRYTANRFGSYPIWVRDIFKRPRLEQGRHWRLWQFANRGRLEGVGTFVDLNAFNGSSADFAAFRCGPRYSLGPLREPAASDLGPIGAPKTLRQHLPAWRIPTKTCPFDAYRESRKPEGVRMPDGIARSRRRRSRSGPRPGRREASGRAA